MVFGQTTTFDPQGKSRVSETPSFLKQLVLNAQPQAQNSNALNYFIQMKINGQPVQKELKFQPSGPAGKGTAFNLLPSADKKRIFWLVSYQDFLGTGKYTAELTYEGKTARVSADLQPVQDLTPPKINVLTLTEHQLKINWSPVKGAKSYTIYLLAANQPFIGKGTVIKAFVATPDETTLDHKDSELLGSLNQNHYVAVIANGWDETASDHVPPSADSNFDAAVGFAVVKTRHDPEVNRQILPSQLYLTSVANGSGTTVLPLRQTSTDAPDLLYTAKIEGNAQVTLTDPGQGRLKSSAGHNLSLTVNCAEESQGEVTLVLDYLNDRNQGGTRIPVKYHCTRNFSFQEKFRGLGVDEKISTVKASAQKGRLMVARQDALYVYDQNDVLLKKIQYPVAGKGATGLSFNADESQLLMLHNGDVYTFDVTTEQFTRRFALSNVVTGTVVDHGFTADQKLWTIMRDAALGELAPYRIRVTTLAGQVTFEDAGFYYVGRENSSQAYRIKVGGTPQFIEALEIQTLDLKTGNVGTPIAMPASYLPVRPNVGNLEISPSGRWIVWARDDLGTEVNFYDVEKNTIKQLNLPAPEITYNQDLEFFSDNVVLDQLGNGSIYRLDASTGQVLGSSVYVEGPGATGLEVLNGQVYVFGKGLYRLSSDLQHVETQEWITQPYIGLKKSGADLQIAQGGAFAWMNAQGKVQEYLHTSTFLPPVIQDGYIMDFSADRSKILHTNISMGITGVLNRTPGGTPDDLPQMLLDWEMHPSRNLLAYAAWEPGNPENSLLVVRDLDSHTDVLKVKIPGSGGDTMLAWSPNGQQLAYYSTTPTHSLQVYDLDLKKVVQTVPLTEMLLSKLLWGGNEKLYFSSHDVPPTVLDLKSGKTSRVAGADQLIALDSTGAYGLLRNHSLISVITGAVLGSPVQGCPNDSASVWSGDVISTTCNLNVVQVHVK
ncbi:PD40 domain-containing protein [Deinococcus cellulosilyticus]|uniref:PD40 domain-containing protein n=1 Tax=Deinococcus cellulosilyticus TaxID=401558 RepID=UPI001649D6FC|nr:PD40 domain-containing protein [Deinococcus cellulosilyticus]